MSLKNKRIMWKASDGREFMVDTSKCDTMEDVQAEIARMRQELGYEEPTFMSVTAAPGVDVGDYPHEDDIEDPELREKVKRTIREGMSRPDPKKMN